GAWVSVACPNDAANQLRLQLLFTMLTQAEQLPWFLLESETGDILREK
ncbi:hypothetical protein AAKU55_005821, partial [Oxalobacteraceae bacterium GrIS 1.11]